MLRYISPFVYNILLKIIHEWKLTKPPGIKLDRNTFLQTQIFVDDQILLSESEDGLQRSVYKLQPILTKYIMKISETKTKAMTMNRKRIPRVKIVINN